LIVATHAAVPLEPGQGGNAAALRDGVRVPWISWQESAFAFFDCSLFVGSPLCER